MLLVASLLLLVRHLFLVAMPFAPSSFFVTTSTSKALVPSSDALLLLVASLLLLVLVRHLFLVAMPFAPSSFFVTTSKALVPSSDALCS